MSLTASREKLQSIRGSIESALTKITDIKTESSSLASDSFTTYSTGLSTTTYSETNRENAIESYTYANHVNTVAIQIENLLEQIQTLIDLV